MNWIALLGLDAFVKRWHMAAMEGAVAAEDRLELAHLEWQAHKHHLRQLLVLAVVVATLMGVAMVLLSFALIIQFWDTPQRAWVAWCVAGVWLIAWATALVALIFATRRTGPALALTRRELAKDWRFIKDRL